MCGKAMICGKTAIWGYEAIVDKKNDLGYDGDVGWQGNLGKTMLPCLRRVHLHKSASFKTIFEPIQTNHKKDSKIDPKIIENQFWNHTKRVRKNIDEYWPQYSKFQIGALILEPVAWLIPGVAHFCLRPVFRNHWGVPPVDRVWPSLGHPWIDFVDFLKIWVGNLLQISKIPEQQMSPTTPSKKTSKD